MRFSKLHFCDRNEVPNEDIKAVRTTIDGQQYDFYPELIRED